MPVFDYDQADWGAQRVFADGELTPVHSSDADWNPIEYAIHYGGNAVTGAYDGVQREKTVLRIYEQSHLSRGWRAIAYNYAFGNSGAVYRLRGENIGGAVRGANDFVRSLLWIGGGTQVPTPEALAAMSRFINDNPQPVNPHSFYRPTACPGDFWREWIEDFEVGVKDMINLVALVNAAFASENPNVKGSRQYWLNLAASDPMSDEWEDLFTAMLTPYLPFYVPIGDE